MGKLGWFMSNAYAITFLPREGESLALPPESTTQDYIRDEKRVKIRIMLFEEGRTMRTLSYEK